MITSNTNDHESRSIDVRTVGGPDYAASLGGTCTGYYVKKFANNISCKNPINYPHSWTIFRYSEILLNAAEAYCEAGELEKAESYVNEIRRRVGMPDYDGYDKDELLKRIRNERRIELAAEGHRFDDIRRYGSDYCKQVMNGPSYAPNGYQVINKVWDDRLLLMPIPQGSIDLNPLLKNDQNPGY